MYETGPDARGRGGTGINDMKQIILILILSVLCGCTYSKSSGMSDGDTLIMHDNSGNSYLITKEFGEIYRVEKFNVEDGKTITTE